MIKKIIAISLFTSALLIGCNTNTNLSESETETLTTSATETNTTGYYSLVTEVMDVDCKKDVVSCKDYNGNIWQFYGVEDWLEGDCCSMIMDSKGTSNVEDDEIIGTSYSAYKITK